MFVTFRISVPPFIKLLKPELHDKLFAVQCDETTLHQTLAEAYSFDGVTHIRVNNCNRVKGRTIIPSWKEIEDYL